MTSFTEQELQYGDLVMRLKRLDEDASLIDHSEHRFHLVIVGGGALILQKFVERATSDIDALYVSPILMELLQKYDINTHVNAYIDSFPYNFEDRLKKLPIDGKKVDFFAASLEDVVIAKLHSNRDKDMQDIQLNTVLQNIDWNTLEKLALTESESQASSFSSSRHDEFLHTYHGYVQEFKPCDS